MAEEYLYGSMVTDTGAALMVQAATTGEKVKVTKLAVGDGSGAYYIPTPDMTALKREVWRGDVNDYQISEKSPNVIEVKAVIPEDVGGFTIREMAIFDGAGHMIAVGNYPDTVKVSTTSGASSQIDITLMIAVDNTGTLKFDIDPNVVVATKKYVGEKITAHDESPEAHADLFAGVETELAAKVSKVTDSNEVRTLTNVITKAYEGYMTGKIVKITIPAKWTHGHFIIKVTIAAAFSTEVCELILKGFARLYDPNPTTWQSLNAILISDSKMIGKVKFAYDGQNLCILLHDVVSNSPTISVDSSIESRSQVVPHDGWDISLITSETGITNITETPVNWVATDDGVWYDLPLVNGATIGLDRTPQYRKVGNRVELRGYINTNGANWNIALAILPAGLRPEIHQNTPVSVPRAQTSSSVFRTMTVDNNNGGIFFNAPTAGDTSTIFDISSSFLVA